MTQPVRISVSLPVPGGIDACLERADWAEQEGFDGVWLADTGEADALTLSAAIAARTRRLRIGTAVVPVFTRTPAVLAATANTMSHLAPDRFVLGLGASSHAMVEYWHGLPFTKPLTRVRETAQVVRAMLAGEKVDFRGDTVRSVGYRVSPPTRGHVPIYIAALREKMLQMAAEVGEGVVLNLAPLVALPKIMEQIGVGAERGGKRVADLEIVYRHQVVVTDDPGAARDLVRQRFAPYFATPVYNKFLAWCGFPEVARTIAEGWAERDRAKTQGALTDELVDQLAIIGDADACREEIRRFVAGGVTTPVISCLSPKPEELQATLEAFSPKVFSA